VVPLLPFDPPALGTFHVVDVRDPREMGPGSRVSLRLRGDGELFGHRLLDRGLMRKDFRDPISTIASRPLGCMAIVLGGDRYATQVDIGGDGRNAYSFTAMIRGKATVIQNKIETNFSGTRGVVFRGAPGTRMLTGDLNARASLWIAAGALEHALEAMVGERLPRPLEFTPLIDWTGGLAASLRGQIDFLIREATRRDGAADNPVALASLTDLIMTLVLRGLPHNYLDRLAAARFGAVPAYMRRADEFMRARAAAPIRMEEVAAAAGCSVRTLNAVFRRFRGTTPLTALHAIRLDQVHAELECRSSDASIAVISRCYGFTNPGRFAAAYRRRFGVSPLETVRRGSR
jgi:AraC-like DNA-binding protein